jgi:hypothetical protein
LVRNLPAELISGLIDDRQDVINSGVIKVGEVRFSFDHFYKTGRANKFGCSGVFIVHEEMHNLMLVNELTYDNSFYLLCYVT